MLLASHKLADGIERLKQNYTELLDTVQVLSDDCLSVNITHRGRYRRWRISQRQKGLRRAIARASLQLGKLAEPAPDAPRRAEFMGQRYPCLQNTQECCRALRRVQSALNRLPDSPRMRVIHRPVQEAIDCFDVSQPVQFRDWPNASDLIANYMSSGDGAEASI